MYATLASRGRSAPLSLTGARALCVHTCILSMPICRSKSEYASHSEGRRQYLILEGSQVLAARVNKLTVLTPSPIGFVSTCPCPGGVLSGRRRSGSMHEASGWRPLWSVCSNQDARFHCHKYFISGFPVRVRKKKVAAAVAHAPQATRRQKMYCEESSRPADATGTDTDAPTGHCTLSARRRRACPSSHGFQAFSASVPRRPLPRSGGPITTQHSPLTTPHSPPMAFSMSS
jgi:hypothetical protein